MVPLTDTTENDMIKCREKCDGTPNCNFFYFYNNCASQSSSCSLHSTMCMSLNAGGGCSAIDRKNCRLFTTCTEHTDSIYPNAGAGTPIGSINGLTFKKIDKGNM